MGGKLGKPAPRYPVGERGSRKKDVKIEMHLTRAFKWNRRWGVRKGDCERM